MATPEQTVPDTAVILGDLGRVHATLRSLAGRVHQADRLDRPEPHELHALSRQIRQYRKLVRDQLGDDLRRWLENLQRRAEEIAESSVSRNDDSCGSHLAMAQTVA